MKIVSFLSLILLLTIGCSSNSDEKLFQEANDLMSEEKLSESLELFDQLINEYPESSLAPRSLMLVAGIYQSKKIASLSAEDAIKKADSIFRSVFDKYPESVEAPTGLFMSGFIQANELYDFTAATNSYNLFLEKYPQHELAASCKEELDNMGLSPDEILKKKIPDQVVNQ